LDFRERGEELAGKMMNMTRGADGEPLTRRTRRS
jgi:hypothetical protein